MVEPDQSAPNRRHKWRRIFLCLALLLLLTVAGVWILARSYGPEFARDQLETALSDALGKPVRIEKLLVRPWIGELGVAGFSIAKGPADTGDMVQLERALVRFRVPRLWPVDVVLTIEVEDLNLELEGEPSAEQAPSEPLEIALPSRFEFGPLTLRLASARLDRAGFLYRDEAAGLEIRIAGINARLVPEGRGFAAGVAADSLDLRLPDLSESARKVELEGTLDPERIAVKRLTLIRDGEVVEARGAVLDPFKNLALDLTVQGKIPLEGLNRFVQSDDWPFSGLLAVAGGVRGPIPSLAAQWTVDAPRLAAGPLTARDVHIRGEWDGRVLRIPELRALVLEGSLQATFDMVPERLANTRANLSLTNVSLKTLDALPGKPLGLHGTLGLDAHMAGDPSDLSQLRAQVEVQGRDIVLPGDAAALGPGRVAIAATLDGGLVTLSNLNGRWNAGALSAGGTAHLNGPFDVRADLSGNMKEIAQAFRLKGFDGTTTVDVRSGGDWRRLVAEGAVQGSLVSATGAEAGRLKLPFRLQEQTLQVPGALARLGESRLETSFDAHWGEQPHFTGKLRAVPVRMKDLAMFMPVGLEAAGAFNLSAQAEGTQAVWQGSGSLDARELSVSNLALENLRAAFSGNQKSVTVDELSLSANGVPMKARGSWSWSGAGDVSLEIPSTELGAVQGVPEDTRLRGTGQASVQGSIRGQTITATGRISLAGVQVQEFALGDGDLRFDVKDSRLTSSLRFPGLKLSGEAAGKLAADGNIEGELVFQEFALEPVLVAFAPEVSEELSGHLTGVAKVRLPFNDPLEARGSLRLDPVRLNVAGERLENEGPMALEVEGGDLRLERWVLKSSGGGRLAASGVWRQFGTMDLKAEAKLPLELLAAFSPEISQAGGTLEVDARLGGTPESPVITGKGKIIDGSIALASYPDAIRQIQGEFGFTPKGGRLQQFSALLGSGSIKASGQIGLEGFDVGAYQAKIVMRDLPVAPVDGLRTAWNVDLELLGFEDRGIVQGEANLLRGDYSRDLSILSLVFDRRASGAGGGGGSNEPPPFDLTLKVRVNLNDNFRVRTPLARLRVGGSLNVEGPVVQPVVFGAIEVSSGHITFQKRRFELSRATVNFVDPRQIDPVLDIEATATIRQYDVTLRLEGRPQDLTINLSSDPSLPEEDLLSLVAFGVTREQFGKSAPGVLAGQAAQLIADDLFGSGGVLHNIDVDTQGGDDGSAVTVSARVDEATTVSFANGNGTNGRRKIRVEHQLLGPVLIAGGQDLEGGFETDIVLRFRFR